MTSQEAVNRGYNLMICAVLFMAGLAFGSVIIAESDAADKVDDAWLLITGVIAVLWYLFGGGRLKRTPIPIALTVLALIGQIIGVVLERTDKEAFGDNIGGMIIFTSVFVLAIYQYLRQPRLEVSRPPAQGVSGGTV